VTSATLTSVTPPMASTSLTSMPPMSLVPPVPMPPGPPVSVSVWRAAWRPGRGAGRRRSYASARRPRRPPKPSGPPAQAAAPAGRVVPAALPARRYGYRVLWAAATAATPSSRSRSTDPRRFPVRSSPSRPGPSHVAAVVGADIGSRRRGSRHHATDGDRGRAGAAMAIHGRARRADRCVCSVLPAHAGFDVRFAVVGSDTADPMPLIQCCRSGVADLMSSDVLSTGRFASDARKVRPRSPAS